jgi:hypothetical protein
MPSPSAVNVAMAWTLEIQQQATCLPTLAESSTWYSTKHVEC